jgi:hypothetical protein
MFLVAGKDSPGKRDPRFKGFSLVTWLSGNDSGQPSSPLVSRMILQNQIYLVT